MTSDDPERPSTRRKSTQVTPVRSQFAGQPRDQGPVKFHLLHRGSCHPQPIQLSYHNALRENGFQFLQRDGTSKAIQKSISVRLRIGFVFVSQK